MPDCALCRGEDKDKICPKRGTCYRYRAVPEVYQNWFTELPYKDCDECRYYWPIKDGMLLKHETNHQERLSKKETLPKRNRSLGE